MSIPVELQGTIKHIGEVETFDSGFVKCTVHVETPGEYGAVFPVDFIKDRADWPGKYSVGDEVTMSLNLTSRYWEKGERYFLGLTCWKIAEVVGDDATHQKHNDGVPGGESYGKAPPASVGNNSEDDLPF